LHTIIHYLQKDSEDCEDTFAVSRTSFYNIGQVQ